MGACGTVAGLALWVTSSPEQYSIRVSAPDLPALGKSDDVVPGLRVVPDFADYFKEVSTAVVRPRAALQDGVQIFLLGESMGGLVAIMALLDEADLHVDGLILCGALVRVTPELLLPAFVTPILRLVSWFSPKTSVPQEVGGDTFDGAFGDPSLGALARADPLVCENAPVRLGTLVTFLTAMNRAKSEGHKLDVGKEHLHDPLKGDGMALYEAARALVDSLEHVKDKVIIPLEGGAHQVFQDTPEKAKEHMEAVGHFIVERVHGTAR
ncbi:unnamed protein product [Discosporangium mesarthrocarpum]